MTSAAVPGPILDLVTAAASAASMAEKLW